MRGPSRLERHLERLGDRGDVTQVAQTGWALMTAMVDWLDEVVGRRVPPRVAQALERAQADLLLVLQRQDDVVDGQSQVAGGPAGSLEAIRRRLEAFLPAENPFWLAFDRLEQEQRRASLWEDTHRGSAAPAFDDALFHLLARKGALLRWPAWALPELAGRPELGEALDALFDRFIGVAILFDDIADFEEDWDGGRVNAVLCAGRVQSREPLHFYPRVAVGAGLVCRKAHDELVDIATKVPGTGLARFCEHRASRCRSVAAVVAERCRIRGLNHLLADLLEAGVIR